ncbi:hypothetical protein [Thalassoroseus pseudoceratinae]|uniref:hypothetical protein n=1 Tax=Thalassoroseus pseudoceratinae TaxID=2713176 RepID=UPI00141EDC5C|nr:hypothetical protein [Thalassoroseus pseudoceratinae]
MKSLSGPIVLVCGLLASVAGPTSIQACLFPSYYSNYTPTYAVGYGYSSYYAPSYASYPTYSAYYGGSSCCGTTSYAMPSACDSCGSCSPCNSCVSGCSASPCGSCGYGDCASGNCVSGCSNGNCSTGDCGVSGSSPAIPSDGPSDRPYDRSPTPADGDRPRTFIEEQADEEPRPRDDPGFYRDRERDRDLDRGYDGTGSGSPMQPDGFGPRDAGPTPTFNNSNRPDPRNLIRHQATPRFEMPDQNSWDPKPAPALDLDDKIARRPILQPARFIAGNRDAWKPVVLQQPTNEGWVSAPSRTQLVQK